MAKEGKTLKVLATTRELHPHKVLSASTVREYRRGASEDSSVKLGERGSGARSGAMDDYFSAPVAVESIGRRGHLKRRHILRFSSQTHFNSHSSDRFFNSHQNTKPNLAFPESDRFRLEVVTLIRQNVLHTFE